MNDWLTGWLVDWFSDWLMIRSSQYDSPQRTNRRSNTSRRWHQPFSTFSSFGINRRKKKQQQATITRICIPKECLGTAGVLGLSHSKADNTRSTFCRNQREASILVLFSFFLKKRDWYLAGSQIGQNSPARNDIERLQRSIIISLLIFKTAVLYTTKIYSIIRAF
jgi:hypothetical protein